MQDQITRSRAYLNALVLLQHPEVRSTLPDYLSARQSDMELWEKRFPGIMPDSHGLTDEVVYGKKLKTAGDMLSTFLKALGGKELPNDIKRDLDSRLK